MDASNLTSFETACTSRKQNLTGRTYHRLTVVGFAEKRPRSGRARWRYFWLCRCDCGTLATVEETQITRGNTKSCGCLAKETQTQKGLRKPKPIILAESDIARFWSLVKHGASNECWMWQMRCDDDGYGLFYAGGKTYRANRVALFLKDGLLDALACHTCDNPPCCNPDHLFDGTAKDNSLDMRQKGRGFRGDHVPYENRKRGEENGNSKLTEDIVRQIHQMLIDGHLQREIAEKFDVEQVTISAIKHGRVWAHIAKDYHHEFGHGLVLHPEIAKGENNARAILREGDVREIKRMLSIGVAVSECARQFGVCNSTIGHIKKGRTWAHVS